MTTSLFHILDTQVRLKSELWDLLQGMTKATGVAVSRLTGENNLWNVTMARQLTPQQADQARTFFRTNGISVEWQRI
jgi:hypothetical protein